jgi:Alginate export
MEHGAWIFPLLLLASSTVLADEAPVTVKQADTGESGASAPQAEEAAETGERPPEPPAYKMLRFTEDYSWLRDPAKRCDLFDPIKYIPLRTNEPSWYLTFGGEVRERFEGNYDQNFGIGSGENSYWMQRVTLLADLHLGERVRFFVEGISGIVAGQSQPAPAVQEDPINLQFAFMDVIPYLTEDERLTLRAGRFGMSLGSGRLVATRAAPNIPFKFDGFEAVYDRPFWHATAFVTRPVIEHTDRFDSEDDGTGFWGLYLTRWFDDSRKSGIDVYYLGISREHGQYASGTGKELRHSFGTRWFGERNQWDWNGEGVAQVGEFGNESILAWTASVDAGYTWEASWKPRLGLKADIASGDNNPTNGAQGTFDALYFKSGYFNDASLIRPENIIDVHPNLSANLTRAITIDGGADVFWRYSRNDAVYAVPGFVAIPALKTASAFVGTALDVNLEWRAQRHLSFLASYVHFLSGDYIHAAGGRDVNYVSTTMSFLF